MSASSHLRYACGVGAGLCVSRVRMWPMVNMTRACGPMNLYLRHPHPHPRAQGPIGPKLGPGTPWAWGPLGRARGVITHRACGYPSGRRLGPLLLRAHASKMISNCGVFRSPDVCFGDRGRVVVSAQTKHMLSLDPTKNKWFNKELVI